MTHSAVIAESLNNLHHRNRLIKIMEIYSLPKQDTEFDSLSTSIQILANPQRLRILCKLADGEADVHDIASHIGSKQSNTSQQLNMMKNRGILASRKDANHVYYRIHDLRTLNIISMVRDVFCSSPIHSSYRYQ